MKNLANGITIFRTAFIIPIGWLLFLQRTNAAAALFLAFLFLDIVDGFLARRLHIESRLGRNLDLLADGVVGIGTLLFLLIFGKIPFWFILASIPALLLMLYSLRLSTRLTPGTFVQWKYKYIAAITYYGMILFFLADKSYSLLLATVLLIVLYCYRIAYHAFILFLLKQQRKK